MSAEAKRGYGSTFALVFFGVAAFYATTLWLLVLIPAAALVWVAASGRAVARSRN